MSVKRISRKTFNNTPSLNDDKKESKVIEATNINININDLPDFSSDDEKPVKPITKAQVKQSNNSSDSSSDDDNDADTKVPAPSKPSTTDENYNIKLQYLYELINHCTISTKSDSVKFGNISKIDYSSMLDDDDDVSDLDDLYTPLEALYNKNIKTVPTTVNEFKQYLCDYTTNELKLFSASDKVNANNIVNKCTSLFYNKFFSYDVYNHYARCSKNCDKAFVELFKYYAVKCTTYDNYLSFQFVDYPLKIKSIDTRKSITSHFNKLAHEYALKCIAKDKENEKIANKLHDMIEDGDEWHEHVVDDKELTFKEILLTTDIIRNTYHYVKFAPTIDQEDILINEYEATPTGKIIQLRLMKEVIIVLDFDIHQAVDMFMQYLNNLDSELVNRYREKYDKLYKYFDAPDIIDNIRKQIIEYLQNKLETKNIPAITTAHGGIHLYLINTEECAWDNNDLENHNRFVNIFKNAVAEHPIDITNDVDYTILSDDTLYHMFQLDVFTSNDYGKNTAGIVAPMTKIYNDDVCKNIPSKDNKYLQYRYCNDCDNKFNADTNLTLSINDFTEACDIFNIITSEYLVKNCVSISENKDLKSFTKAAKNTYDKFIKQYSTSFNEYVYNHDAEKITKKLCKGLQAIPNKTIHRSGTNCTYTYNKDNVKDESSYHLDMFHIGCALNSIDKQHSDIHEQLLDFIINNASTNDFELTSNATSCIKSLNDVTKYKPSDLSYFFKFIECAAHDYYCANLKAYYNNATKYCKTVFRNNSTASVKQSMKIIPADADKYENTKVEHIAGKDIIRAATYEDKMTLLCKCIRYYSIPQVYVTYLDKPSPIICDDVAIKKVLASVLEGKYVTTAFEQLTFNSRNDICEHVDINELFDGFNLGTLVVPDVIPNATKTREQCVDMFKKVIETNLCAGETKCAKVLYKIIAHCIQHPTEPVKVCVVISGLEGTGKTWFTDILCSLLGKYTNKACTVIQTSQYSYNNGSMQSVCGEFNGQIENKVIVVINEVANYKEEKYISNEQLKKLITDKYVEIHYKGKTRFVTTNCAHVFITTNSARAVPVTTSDRRFFVLNPDAHYANDKTYWKEYFDVLNEPYFYKYIYDEFADATKYDLSDIYTMNIPNNRAKLIMALATCKLVERFILSNFHLFNESFTKDEVFQLFKDIKSEYSKDTLHDDFIKYNVKFEQLFSEVLTTLNIKKGNRKSVRVGKKVFTDYVYTPDETRVKHLGKLFKVKMQLSIGDDEEDDTEEEEDDTEEKDEEDDTDIKHYVDNLVKILKDGNHKVESQKGDFYFITCSELHNNNDEPVFKEILEVCGFERVCNKLNKKTTRYYKLSATDFDKLFNNKSGINYKDIEKEL